MHGLLGGLMGPFLSRLAGGFFLRAAEGASVQGSRNLEGRLNINFSRGICSIPLGSKTYFDKLCLSILKNQSLINPHPPPPKKKRKENKNSNIPKRIVAVYHQNSQSFAWPRTRGSSCRPRGLPKHLARPPYYIFGKNEETCKKVSRGW